jgi:hypothetical protein
MRRRSFRVNGKQCYDMNLPGTLRVRGTSSKRKGSTSCQIDDAGEPFPVSVESGRVTVATPARRPVIVYRDRAK